MSLNVALHNAYFDRSQRERNYPFLGCHVTLCPNLYIQDPKLCI